MRFAAFCAKAQFNDAIRSQAHRILPIVLIVIIDLSSIDHLFDFISVIGDGAIYFFKCVLQIAEHIMEIDGIQLIHLVLEIVQNTVYVVKRAHF